ncbi:hypothetical protein [Hymenobacter cellulosilyticus]|uniref:Uncharacterized protein n=1 Tax=Hymenobacter cellulosilyticus TaxID=2932248 RepID=A0A8T9QCM2_9BACT|nr:hypothetical protein [Hymenobacter cellulosilyticus]UOQ73590.1 hypothetical protein MUN79_06585 [Hymenobacter cellulosilyticus]
MRLFRTPLCHAAALLALVDLNACSEKTEVSPEQVSCGTQATVRLCPGYTMMCLTEHTTLELADGTRLHPRGPLWSAYLPKQVGGQVLSIGYRLSRPEGIPEEGVVYSEITCLKPVDRRGTTAPSAGNR